MLYRGDCDAGVVADHGAKARLADRFAQGRNRGVVVLHVRAQKNQAAVGRGWTDLDAHHRTGVDTDARKDGRPCKGVLNSRRHAMNSPPGATELGPLSPMPDL